VRAKKYQQKSGECFDWQGRKFRQQSNLSKITENLFERPTRAWVSFAGGYLEDDEAFDEVLFNLSDVLRKISIAACEMIREKGFPARYIV